jgi:small subunit ribosomal protein S1
MSWTRKVRHPSKIVSVGEEVEAIVLDIKPDNRRISLGMKQIAPNPWDVISEKYPIGTTIEGKIKNITDFGIFIGIDEGIDGLVHISDISWTKRIKHPSEVYKKGEVIQAIVLDIEKANERFSLGIKHLTEDPWKTVAERYEVGKEITGTITNLTDFGVFVELEEGIEGLVHVSEISKEKIKTPIGMYNVGDLITARVMNINSDERRIGLSIKRLDMEDDQTLLSEYVNNMKPATSTFGEILRENLQGKLSETDARETEDVEESGGPPSDDADETAEPVADSEEATAVSETGEAAEPETGEAAEPETEKTADGPEGDKPAE